MRLAVPEHQGRLAPVFDCCRRLIIVLQGPLGDEPVQDEDWASLPRLSRTGRLVELKVELVVCGGISCWMEDQIHRHGIRLIPWIAGDLWDVLGALREGRIYDPRYAMPGRAGCARRKRGQGCGRKNHSGDLARKERKNAWI
jgi:hypothetical protein